MRGPALAALSRPHRTAGYKRAACVSLCPQASWRGRALPSLLSAPLLPPGRNSRVNLSSPSARGGLGGGAPQFHRLGPRDGTEEGF